MPRSLSILPENIREPLVVWRFQGVKKETSGMKWVKVSEGFLRTWFKMSPKIYQLD